MNFKTALRLGRVSNLPTVWSNVLAALVLSGGAFSVEVATLLAIAMSCMYVGGMYLNDAFDREHDRRERPERPIPSGAASAASVFAIGFSLLAAGIVLMAAQAYGQPDGLGLPPVLAMCALAAVIVYYDVHHKQNALSPVVMALNRVLVYVATALAVAPEPSRAIVLGAGALCCYLIGLSYAAKQENLLALRSTWPLALLAAPLSYVLAVRSAAAALAWVVLAAATGYSLRYLLVPRRRDIKRAVTQLIAGISLLDALLVTVHGRPQLAAPCVAAFVLTLGLQRFVPGT